MITFDKIAKACGVIYLIIGVYCVMVKDPHILGYPIIAYGFLSLYATFFTDNSQVFLFLTPLLTRSWSKLFGKNANKAINFFAIFINFFVGLILLRLPLHK